MKEILKRHTCVHRWWWLRYKIKIIAFVLQCKLVFCLKIGPECGLFSHCTHKGNSWDDPDVTDFIADHWLYCRFGVTGYGPSHYVFCITQWWQGLVWVWSPLQDDWVAKIVQFCLEVLQKAKSEYTDTIGEQIIHAFWSFGTADLEFFSLPSLLSLQGKSDSLAGKNLVVFGVWSTIFIEHL